MHEYVYTLELQLQPYWLVLEMLVGGRFGAETLAQLQFGMWLVALPTRGYHAIPLPVLNGWLMHLLVFYNEFCG